LLSLFLFASFVPSYSFNVNSAGLPGYLNVYSALTWISIVGCYGTLPRIVVTTGIGLYFLSPYFDFLPLELVSDLTTGLSCQASVFTSSAYSGSRSIHIVVSPSFTSYQTCFCPNQGIFWNAETNLCEQCPSDNPLCGGNPAIGSTQLTVKSGYYPVDLRSKALDLLAQTPTSPLLESTPTTVLVPCSSQAVCNPDADTVALLAQNTINNQNTEYQCGLGYDSSSLLCLCLCLLSLSLHFFLFFVPAIFFRSCLF
jgi:hypothetical protein